MAVTVTHAFVSTVPDDPDQAAAGAVVPSNWNDDHTVSGTLDAAQLPAFTGDVTGPGGSAVLTLATAQPAVHTWALAQTFTVAPVFTDAAATRTALGLGALATVTPGTGVATALAIAVGSAGAPVLFNGAGGTPSSMTGTNITGTASGLTVGNVTGTGVGSLTSLAIGGATIGSNALAVTGTTNISGNATFGGNLVMPAASGSNITAWGNTNINFQQFYTEFLSGGTAGLRVRSNGVMQIAGPLAFASVIGGTEDLFFERDAANTKAQRNGTAAQVANHYDTWASATDYHRVALKTARATLSGVTGASVTATNLIPDGAIPVGVTTKVTTGLGTGSGTTGYTVGDGTDVDRWGAVVGTASGTSSDNRDWTATTVQAFTAANNVVITASGGNFDGTGVIYVSVQYLIGECD